MVEEWTKKIEEYCNIFNIPLYFLSDTLLEPKVIPMIRGKSFEFTVYDLLKNHLDNHIWEVSKPNMNSQLNSHDVDVQIKDKRTGKEISLECKLSGKGGCRVTGETTEIKVKCMRSRTLGIEMVRSLSVQRGIPEDVLTIHNDQYLPTDFDFVITSIGNSFYQTVDNQYVFQPTENQLPFLNNFPNINLRDETFNTLYISRSTKISVNTENHVVCTRHKCQNKTNCGFIPNYPIIKFNTNSLIPTNNWYPINRCHELFTSFCNE